MYEVFIDRWNDRRTSIDAYALTGKVYKCKHDAEIEVLEHLEELQDDPAVNSYYIKEV
jgi:hypothetical protein